jgi:hypothetical protein
MSVQTNGFISRIAGLRPLNHESISLYRVSLKSACQPSARRVSACEAGERVLSGLSRYAMSSSCGWQGIPRRRSASCAAARRGRESPSSPVPATWRGKFLAEFPEFSNERPNEDFHVSLPGVIRRLLFKYFLGGKFARERPSERHRAALLVPILSQHHDGDGHSTCIASASDG